METVQSCQIKQGSDERKKASKMFARIYVGAIIILLVGFLMFALLVAIMSFI